MSSSCEKFEEAHKMYTASLISNFILPAIVEFLEEEKKVQITVEELEQVLHLPTTSIPSMAIPPVIRSGSRRRKSISPTLSGEEPAFGEGCRYQMVRGPNKGNYCGKKCVNGSAYCSSHKSKGKKVRKKTQESKTKTTSSGNVGASPSLVTKKDEAEEAIRVNPYRDIKGHFIHPETNFILLEEDEMVIVIAREEEDGKLRSLTDEEKVEARKYALVTVESEEKEKEVLKRLVGNVQKTIKKEDEGSSTDAAPIPTPPTPVVPILPDIPTVPSI